MNLTSQNTDLQQVQQVLRSILTEIETRKVSGERVARVATPETRGKGDKPMAPETFDSWLRTQANRRDPIGDLARDYADDCTAHGVTAMTLTELRASMIAQHACSGALRALTLAQRQWQQQQSKETRA